MALENYTGNIADMVVTNPTPTDPKSQGDDHLRGIKHTLKQSFPNFDGPLTAARVPFAPAGTIAANNVQAAVQELDTEKLSLSGGTVTGQINGIAPVEAANLTRKDYVDSVTSGAAFSATRFSQLNLTSGVATAIPDMTAEFNVGNAFNGQRFQPTKPGIYQINGGVRVNGTTLSAVSLSINKSNVSAYEIVTFSASGTGINGGSGGVSTYLNGTDWVELSVIGVGTSPFVVSAMFSACFLQPA